MACEIYQLAPQTHTQMMGYVIRDGAGRLTVIDGGTRGDSAALMRLLRCVGGEKPHIGAWFLTHPHSDHVAAFYELLRGSAEAFTLDALYAHFPQRSVLEKGEPRALPMYDEYFALRPQFAERERLLEEGQRFRIGECVWETLYVSDPSFVHNASNNSSAVLRLEVEGVRVLFLGDLGVEGGEKLLKNHGANLQSQIVQMAHHGQSAVAMDVYRAIRPEACLWCAPKWLWDNDQGCRGYDSGEWDILRVREEMARLGVRRHVVAKDGTACLRLAQGRFTVSCADPFAAQ